MISTKLHTSQSTTDSTEPSKRSAVSLFLSWLSYRQINDNPHQKPLFFCVVLVLIPHTFFQTVDVLVYCALTLVWQLLIMYQRIRPTMRITHIVLALAAIAIIFPEPGVSLSQNAGTQMLLMMMCLKLSEAISKRDTAVMTGMCLFTLVTLFIFSSSIITLAWSLFVIHCLFCLQSSMTTNSRFTVLELRQIKLMLKATLLALPLYLLLPTPNGPLWDIANPGFAASTGLADSVTPGQFSQLEEDDEVVFRVQFHTPAPATSQMYWRGPVFTFYDGQRWSEPDFITDQDNFNTLIKPATKNAAAPAKAEIHNDHYDVTLAPHHRNWLFTLHPNTPAPVNSQYSRVGELLAHQAVTSTHNYGIKPGRPARHAIQVEPYSLRYLQLPNLYSWRTRKLAESFTADLDSSRPRDLQIITRAVKYFHQQDFRYTRQAPLAKYDPVDEFMFKHRKGYCEHFASAFAFMMRVAGIPSRIVTGYSGADYNAGGDYYVVRKSHAHAWTEIWLKDQGWISVDPTRDIPLLNNPATEIPSLASEWLSLLPADLKLISQKLGLVFDSLDYGWEKNIIGSNNKWQDNFSNLLFSGKTVKVFFWILGITILFCMLFVSRQIATSRLYWPSRQPAELARRSYTRFCKKMAKAGFNRAAHECPSDFAKRITLHRPELFDSVNEITRLYNSVNYSQSAPDDAARKLGKITRSL